MNSGIFWILVDKNTVLGQIIVTDKQIKFAGFRSDLFIVASANKRTVPKVFVNKMASIGSGGSRIFPRGGREPSRGGVNTPNFPENCMKSKEFGRPGGGVRPSRPPPRSANDWDLVFLFDSHKTVCFSPKTEEHSGGIHCEIYIRYLDTFSVHFCRLSLQNFT